jgi:hypothetical protein
VGYHQAEPHILLFRRSLDTDPETGRSFTATYLSKRKRKEQRKIAELINLI